MGCIHVDGQPYSVTRVILTVRGKTEELEATVS